MILKAARYARLNDTKLEISLFPFLSIFLCVMGVLSFINVLSSFSAPQKIEMTAQLEQGYKVAYQIFSLPDGIISVPPTKHLKQLRQAVKNSKTVDQGYVEVIDEILQQREQTMNRLESIVKNKKSSIMNAAVEPDVDDILDTMRNIRTLNEIALRTNYLYEEFLLFGIYPNGGQAYQKLRDVMTLTQDSRAISIGLEPLDSNWTLNLKTHKNKSQ